MSFYHLPNPYDPRYAIPRYVMAEPPGRGTFTTQWLPRGTIPTLVPDYLAKPGKELLGRDDAGLGSLGGSTIRGSSIHGSSLKGSTLAGSSLGDVERIYTLEPLGGSGPLPKTTWCSVANPQPGCTPVAGVAKPMDPTTLLLYQTMQRVMNRILAKKGKTLVAVDGRIGPGTVTGMKAIVSLKTTDPAFIARITHDQIAALAAGAVEEMTTFATEMGAPFVGDPKTASPPSTPGPSGTVLHPPDKIILNTAGADLVSTLKTPLGLAAIAVAGLLVFKSTKGARRARR